MALREIVWICVLVWVSSEQSLTRRFWCRDWTVIPETRVGDKRGRNKDGRKDEEGRKAICTWVSKVAVVSNEREILWDLLCTEWLWVFCLRDHKREGIETESRTTHSSHFRLVLVVWGETEPTQNRPLELQPKSEVEGYEAPAHRVQNESITSWDL